MSRVKRNLSDNKMFSQSMIIWVYMHLFVNVVMAHATTAILIILTGFRFLVRIPKKYVYVKIK